MFSLVNQKLDEFYFFATIISKKYPTRISALSLIIMRGKNGELRKLRNAALETGLHCIDFLETMTGNTYVEQLEKTKATKTDDLVFYGVGVFGEIEKLNPLTKKLSLWK